MEKQVDELPWRIAEARSIDETLLSNQSEGLARERDAQGEQIQAQSNRQ